jgi:hypothetical protein
LELKLDVHNFHSLKALLWLNESGKWEGVLGDKLIGTDVIEVIRSQRVIMALPTEADTPREKMQETVYVGNRGRPE